MTFIALLTEEPDLLRPGSAKAVRVRWLSDGDHFTHGLETVGWNPIDALKNLIEVLEKADGHQEVINDIDNEVDP